MTPSALFIHLFNFAAPALGVAFLLALLCRISLRAPVGARGWWKQAAVTFVAGVIVLAAALAWFGQDGRIATYAALVVVCGTVQWWQLRGSR